MKIELFVPYVTRDGHMALLVEKFPQGSDLCDSPHFRGVMFYNDTLINSEYGYGYGAELFQWNLDGTETDGDTWRAEYERDEPESPAYIGFDIIGPWVPGTKFLPHGSTIDGIDISKVDNIPPALQKEIDDAHAILDARRR